ncbi:hypothetical protein NUW54_g6700 [Trametes sanguinea]|uniref:Uncharacterized protein n=1 Tax=Trametes sanguinea TaxID=158606 RepID=A0ACC1PSN5_9APHY|nr:hypothetical protein NUW54_g6700 [Trametes sanguinea]
MLGFPPVEGGTNPEDQRRGLRQDGPRNARARPPSGLTFVVYLTEASLKETSSETAMETSSEEYQLLFPGSHGSIPPPPPVPPTNDLFSPSETTDLFGFLENFDWDFNLDSQLPDVPPDPLYHTRATAAAALAESTTTAVIYPTCGYKAHYTRQEPFTVVLSVSLV